MFESLFLCVEHIAHLYKLISLTRVLSSFLDSLLAISLSTTSFFVFLPSPSVNRGVFLLMESSCVLRVLLWLDLIAGFA